MQIRCCASSTGCRFVTESTTSWLWWLTRSTAIGSTTMGTGGDKSPPTANGKDREWGGVGWQHACAMQTNMVPLNFFSVVAPMSTAPVYLPVSSHQPSRNNTNITFIWHFTGPFYHSPGLSSRSVPYDAQLHLSGTHYTFILHQQRLTTWKISADNLLFPFIIWLYRTRLIVIVLITFPPAPLKLRPMALYNSVY